VVLYISARIRDFRRKAFESACMYNKEPRL
jgi:hypothetical protein